MRHHSSLHPCNAHKNPNIFPGAIWIRLLQYSTELIDFFLLFFQFCGSERMVMVAFSYLCVFCFWLFIRSIFDIPFSWQWLDISDSIHSTVVLYRNDLITLWFQWEFWKWIRKYQQTRNISAVLDKSIGTRQWNRSQ